MKRELARLSLMLKENKISLEDYKLLSAALNQRSMFSSLENSMLINPFQKIAGLKALLLGFVLMAAMSFMGTLANIFYDGILGYLLPVGIKTTFKPNFFLLLYQNAVACLTLGILFFLTAMLLRLKQVRFIDFIGMAAMARFPLFISVTFTYLESLLRPDLFKFDYSKGIELHLDIFGVISSLLLFLCVIWQIITYFFALKESSGLEGKKLWVSFLTIMLFGEVIAIIGARLFFYIPI